jgi:hypothetical protein
MYLVFSTTVGDYQTHYIGLQCVQVYEGQAHMICNNNPCYGVAQKLLDAVFLTREMPCQVTLYQHLYNTM